MKNFGWILMFILSVNFVLSAQNINEQNEIEIDSLLAKMTLEEKINLLGGTGFASKPIERIGIPEIKMTDGPVGVRWDEATAFPVSIAMAATWNVDLINSIGKSLANETMMRDRNMILGPCVNLVRTPHGGRNFESFGEDPYLTSRLAVSYIKGVEENGVIASIKHFAVNNQEFERMTISAEVDERVLREIYLPAFEAAVKEANVSTVMAAYNRLNGIYCAENDFLLNKILKDEWGFKGFVVSDWGAVHSTKGTANFGIDLEMPNGKFLNNTLYELIENGEVDINVINDKVKRILRVISKFNFLKSINNLNEDDILKTSSQKAFHAASESIVLLKNENNILPINLDLYKKIAVLGPNAAVNISGGGGSSKVNPINSISPLEALKNIMPSDIQLIYAQGSRREGQIEVLSSEYLSCNFNSQNVKGLKAEYFTNPNLEGQPQIVRVDEQLNFLWGSGGPDPKIGKDNYSVRWTGKLIAPFSGNIKLGTVSDDGVRLYLNNKLIIDNWTNHAAMFDGFDINLEEGKEYDIKIEFYEDAGDAVFKFGYITLEDTLISAAVEAAELSDIAILFLGTSDFFESEGFDRKDLNLPEDQLKLLNSVLEVNKNVIVVLNNGGQILMSDWIGRTSAVLEAWFPGQEGGKAVADILVGKINPSGKLPYTIPQKWEDCSAYPYYPGSGGKIFYGDGLFIGYRHFDKYNIQPLFHFGYGLSYTQFKLSGINVNAADSKINVSLTVSNIGNKEGSEVVQVYVSDKTNKTERPLKELKKFEKVFLLPGESKIVNLELSFDALKYYSIEKAAWTYEPGIYEILVGSLSADSDLIKNIITVK